MSRFRRTAVLLGASFVIIAGCGSDKATSKPTTASAPSTASAGPTAASPGPTAASSPSGAAGSAGSVVDTSATGTSATGTSAAGVAYSVKAANGTVTLAAKPVKIVSLSPTHTEMLFAIGAGAQVIAVDDQSNYPAGAVAVKSDLSGFTPNVEAIAGYKPDLVVVGDDTNNALTSQLGALKIPVWSGPAATSLDDVYTEIEQLGVLTGHIAESTKLVADMQSDIKSILAEVPQSGTPLTYYHELDPTYFSTRSTTFIGQIYSLAGLHNIADGAAAGNDYPQLNSEFIVSAKPQLIFLADTKCCGQTPATVAARDGWSDIPAVKNRGVIAMDDDIASRWGPRVVDYLRAVVAAVKTAAQVPAG